MKPTPFAFELDDNMAFAIAHEDPFSRAYLIPDYATSHEYRTSPLAAQVSCGLQGPLGDRGLLPTALVIVEEMAS